jgi:8-oxo-dGTP pyrophosphatase MutT (NUDIX family)
MPDLVSRAVALARLLAAHAPFDALERVHQGRMLSLTAALGDAFAREHYEPGHFTASAFVLSPARDALLLIHHRKLDRWLQPGGHVEPADKDLLAAARREAREEVGLAELHAVSDGPFDLDVHVIPARPGEPAHSHFDVRYLFVAPSLELELSNESKGARWVPLLELTGPGVDASVARAAHKLLAERA